MVWRPDEGVWLTEGAANAGKLKGLYSAVAAAYEEIWAPLLRPFGLRLLDRVPLAGASRVLDLGCGVGKLLADIEQRAPGATVVGADLTEDMLRQGLPRFPRVAMDCTRPAFATGAFDAVVSAFMLFHVPQPLVALRCAREMLRPGGAIAIAVWGTGEVFPAMEAWDDELDRLGVPRDPSAGGPDGREQTDSPRKMTVLLADAGFEDVKAETAEWILPWSLADFLEWSRRMGPSGRRLAQLDPDARETVFARARERVEAMGEVALLHRDEVVLSSGRAPA
jgi:SAM-dependent methyltransferase